MTETTAGRELDALVAEKVFGWTDCRLDWRHMHGGSWYVPTGIRPDGAVDEFPHYSSDIASAWLVVEHFRGPRECDVRITCFSDRTSCEITWPSGAYDTATEDWPPFAICRAALLAVEAGR